MFNELYDKIQIVSNPFLLHGNEKDIDRISQLTMDFVERIAEKVKLLGSYDKNVLVEQFNNILKYKEAIEYNPTNGITVSPFEDSNKDEVFFNLMYKLREVLEQRGSANGILINDSIDKIVSIFGELV